jgi:hypothetical protein
MPENTEAMPEISASPAPQDAKPADTGEKKQKILLLFLSRFDMMTEKSAFIQGARVGRRH